MPIKNKLFIKNNSLFQRIIVFLEDSDCSWFCFFLTFVFAISLRNFLEIFSAQTKAITPEAILHYSFFYLSLALTVVLLSFFITREKINKIARVVFPCFIVVVLVPLFDLLLSGGRGHNIVYLSPENSGNLLVKFFTFLSGWGGAGISPGMRLEIVLVLVFFLAYFYLKTRKFLRSLLGIFVIYSLFFLYNTSPVILSSFFSFLDIKYLNTNFLFLQAYLLSIFVITSILAFLYRGKFLKDFLKNIKPFKLLFFEFIFALGIIYGLWESKFVLNSANFFGFFLAPVGIALAWFFVAIRDDPPRKLFGLGTKKHFYLNLSWVFLLSSILYGWAVSFEVCFLILVFAGNFFLYSAPPFQIKKIPILAEIIVSLNALILFMTGFIFITAGSFLDFPSFFWPVFLISGTLFLIIYNLKNYKAVQKILK